MRGIFFNPIKNRLFQTPDQQDGDEQQQVFALQTNEKAATPQRSSKNLLYKMEKIDENNSSQERNSTKQDLNKKKSHHKIQIKEQSSSSSNDDGEQKKGKSKNKKKSKDKKAKEVKSIDLQVLNEKIVSKSNLTELISNTI